MLFALSTACCVIAILIIGWLSTRSPQSTDFEISPSLVANYTLRILSGDSDMIDEPSNEARESRRANRIEAANDQDETVRRRQISSSPLGNAQEQTRTESAGNAAAATDESAVDNEPISVCFRLLNETQRIASVRPLQTVGEVKRIYFRQELNTNQLVRFIFRGRLLKDHETLRSCEVTDNTTVHCFITAPPPPPPAPSTSNEPDGEQSVYGAARALDVSRLLVPMLTVALLGAWLLRVKFRRLFSPTSTILLVLITLIYATGLASVACQHISTRASSTQ